MVDQFDYKPRSDSLDKLDESKPSTLNNEQNHSNHNQLNSNLWSENIQNQQNGASKQKIHIVIETKKMVKKFEAGKKFINQYEITKFLGSGTFGKVKKAISKFNKREYAIKIMSRSRLENHKIYAEDKQGEPIYKNALDIVQREITILKKINHPNIITLYEVINDESHDKIYLVQEYAQLGQLLTWDDKQLSFEMNKKFISFLQDKNKQTNDQLSFEQILCYIARQSVKALNYLHQCGVIHRDIKPQNILLDKQCNIKLSDFGLATIADDLSEDIKNTDGTYHFMAPEFFEHKKKKQRIDQICILKQGDIWALGITFYSIIYKKLPFYDENIMKLFDKIQTQKLEFPSQPDISHELKQLLIGMLNKNPEKRITLDLIKQNPWIVKMIPSINDETQCDNNSQSDSEELDNNDNQQPEFSNYHSQISGSSSNKNVNKRCSIFSNQLSQAKIGNDSCGPIKKQSSGDSFDQALEVPNEHNQVKILPDSVIRHVNIVEEQKLSQQSPKSSSNQDSINYRIFTFDDIKQNDHQQNHEVLLRQRSDTNDVNIINTKNLNPNVNKNQINICKSE